MSIYEKSTNQLLTEYIKANLKPGQVMDKDQIVSWFKSNYPKIKSNTVNCHIIKFTTNHKTRIHYNASPANDILFQLPKTIFYKIEVISMEFHDLKKPGYSALDLAGHLIQMGYEILKMEHLATNQNLNYGRLIARRIQVL